MAPSRYLLRALSKPTKVDEQTWQTMYSSQHIPDVVQSGMAVRGAIWRAHNDFSLATKTPVSSNQTDLHGAKLSHYPEGPADKIFCAVYQTPFSKPAERKEALTIPMTSPLLNNENIMTSADWDMRVYELIQDYDPDNHGDTLAPFVLHVQNSPADDEDYNRFYEDLHLPDLHTVPGYRKSQRYKLIDTITGTPPDPPRFLAVHEFEHLDALDGPELRAADAKPWVHRVFGNASAVNIRGFKCVSHVGYEGSSGG